MYRVWNLFYSGYILVHIFPETQNFANKTLCGHYLDIFELYQDQMHIIYLAAIVILMCLSERLHSVLGSVMTLNISNTNKI